MTKHYKVTHAEALANGAVMLSGVVKGELIEIGELGIAIANRTETQIIVRGVRLRLSAARCFVLKPE